MEELLGLATTDDGDEIDTFRCFTEILSEENHLDQASSIELNKRIPAICRRFPTLFSSTLPKEPAFFESK